MNEIAEGTVTMQRRIPSGEEDRTPTAHGAEGASQVRLGDLPPPPPGREGWPWTEEGPQAAQQTPHGSPWPRVTVVTPSFNQAEFLEETIRSVLLQGYPDLEYIVMDGGSTDGSVEIIERYAQWISHWQSQPDDGQSDAINAGFARATGVVIGWLNSDDVYLPGALMEAGAHLADGSVDIFVGAMDKVLVQDGQAEFVKRSSPFEGDPIQQFPVFTDGRHHEFHFTQPPALWTRALWQRVGGLDERYHYQMDREWLHRALAGGARVQTSDRTMARFALHPGSKSQDFLHRFHGERWRMYLRLSTKPGFRFWPCVVAALHPAQQVLNYHARAEGDAGRPLRAFSAGLTAKMVGVARRLAPRPSGPGSAPPSGQ